MSDLGLMPRSSTARLRWLSSYYDASTPPEAVATGGELPNGRRRRNGTTASTAPPEPDVPVEPQPEPEPEPEPETG